MTDTRTDMAHITIDGTGLRKVSLSEDGNWQDHSASLNANQARLLWDWLTDWLKRHEDDRFTRLAAKMESLADEVRALADD
jgi:hypothetical protein